MTVRSAQSRRKSARQSCGCHLSLTTHKRGQSRPLADKLDLFGVTQRGQTPPRNTTCKAEGKRKESRSTWRANSWQIQLYSILLLPKGVVFAVGGFLS